MQGGVRVVQGIISGVGRTLSKPILSEHGIQTILRMLSERKPAAGTAQPHQFIDGRFVRELEASGFVDALYRKSLPNRP